MKSKQSKSDRFFRMIDSLLFFNSVSNAVDYDKEKHFYDWIIITVVRLVVFALILCS